MEIVILLWKLLSFKIGFIFTGWLMGLNNFNWKSATQKKRNILFQFEAGHRDHM